MEAILEATFRDFAVNKEAEFDFAQTRISVTRAVDKSSHPDMETGMLGYGTGAKALPSPMPEEGPKALLIEKNASFQTAFERAVKYI